MKYKRKVFFLSYSFFSIKTPFPFTNLILKGVSSFQNIYIDLELYGRRFSQLPGCASKLNFRWSRIWLIHDWQACLKPIFDYLKVGKIFKNDEWNFLDFFFTSPRDFFSKLDHLSPFIWKSWGFPKVTFYVLN